MHNARNVLLTIFTLFLLVSPTLGALDISGWKNLDSQGGFTIKIPPGYTYNFENHENISLVSIAPENHEVSFVMSVEPNDQGTFDPEGLKDAIISLMKAAKITPVSEPQYNKISEVVLCFGTFDEKLAMCSLNLTSDYTIFSTGLFQNKSTAQKYSEIYGAMFFSINPYPTNRDERIEPEKISETPVINPEILPTDSPTVEQTLVPEITRTPIRTSTKEQETTVQTKNPAPSSTDSKVSSFPLSEYTPAYDGGATVHIFNRISMDCTIVWTQIGSKKPIIVVSIPNTQSRTVTVPAGTDDMYVHAGNQWYKAGSITLMSGDEYELTYYMTGSSGTGLTPIPDSEAPTL